MKYPIIATVVVAVATAALCGEPASAQDFGRMLGRLAERTAERAARNGADELTRGRPSSERRGERAAPAEASAAGAQAEQASGGNGVLPAPAGVEPWPVNAGHRLVTRTNELVFPQEMVAQKEAFRAASVFACQGCEGSRDIDSWQKFLRPSRDADTAISEMIGGWTVGRVIEWRGRALDGRITVLSEVPVGAFQCRQLRHRISTRGRDPVVTERPGLICFAKRERYSSVDLWHEVF